MVSRGRRANGPIYAISPLSGDDASATTDDLSSTTKSTERTIKDPCARKATLSFGFTQTPRTPTFGVIRRRLASRRGGTRLYLLDLMGSNVYAPLSLLGSRGHA